MPTYDYKCLKCDYTFEFFQPMSANPITECPQCGGNLKRLIGAGAGTIFKGSGFYQTDYKNKGTTPSNGNGKKEVPKPSGDKSEPKTGNK